MGSIKKPLDRSGAGEEENVGGFYLIMSMSLSESEILLMSLSYPFHKSHFSAPIYFSTVIFNIQVKLSELSKSPVIQPEVN